MKNLKFFSAMAVLLGALFAPLLAHAGVHTDAHGNVAYDTAMECDAAVLSGNAKFYQPFTHKKPLLQRGEHRVVTATLRELGAEYAKGACDIGVGRKMGRDGVSTVLQGKFIPFSPDMPINVYIDATGNARRVTMAQCDNWFSSNSPRAVVWANNLSETPVNTETTSMQPEVVAPVAAVAASSGHPYVFGTLGAARSRLTGQVGELLVNGVSLGTASVRASDQTLAGQVGFGWQFNPFLGAELFYQGGKRYHFTNGKLYSDTGLSLTDVDAGSFQNHIYGGRLTLGPTLGDHFRIFGKAGVAGIYRKLKDEDRANGYGKHTQAVPTVGVGATYHFNDHWALRGDYDHYFKGKQDDVQFKGQHYFGVGVQYNFK